MESKPQIPTLGGKEKDKESKSSPLLKIKGLASSGGGSLVERLKQFKKKDLAFILAGLGVLFMAPLAEHFMMAPEAGDDSLKPGFSRGGGSLFGSGGSPYETGVNGLAPGGVAGGGSDVITPLNVRDPAALVMGPGATQQAPAGAPQPSAPPPPKEDSSKWNDAVSAAKAGAKAAAKSGGLPVPKVPLSAGGLRGLGAVSGGSGSSFGLGPVGPAAGSGRPAQSNGLTGTSNSGFKGVARGPGTGAGGAFENLKKNAGMQGGDLNRGGSASSALEQAASREMGNGQGGGAGQGSGKDDKAGGGNQNKDSKSPGESLEFLRQKMEMEKAIDLKWKLKEKAAMLWPNLKEKLLEEALMTPFKALTKGVADNIGAAGDATNPGYSCQGPNGPMGGKVSKCTGDRGKWSGCTDGSNYYANGSPTSGVSCQSNGGGADTSAGNPKGGAAVDTMGADCSKISAMATGQAGPGIATSNQNRQKSYREMLNVGCQVASGKQELKGSADYQKCCGGAP